MDGIRGLLASRSVCVASEKPRPYTGWVYSSDRFPHAASVGAEPGASTQASLPTGSAGFGSPGSDATVKRIDLNDALIRHPQATFVMRVSGDAMREAGIEDGDVLLVDRALVPQHGQVVVAVVDGELFCRRLSNRASGVSLEAAAPGHAAIALAADRQLELWGVVTTVIKSLLS